MNIAIITIGSRGDVQPYVALGMGLAQRGHTVRLATGLEFETFVTSHGLNFEPIHASFLELVQSGAGEDVITGNPLAAIKHLRKLVLPMYRTILDDAWQAAQGADCILYDTKSLGGISIAEKLDIPVLVASPTPLLTPTREFPHPLVPPGLQLGGRGNRASHALLNAAMMIPYQSTLDTWREETLGLPPRKLSDLRQNGRPIPVLYPFSPRVIPAPADWSDEVAVTGYWFLPHDADWQPPAALVDFLAEGPPPVYVGFGSMAQRDPQRVTQVTLAALERAGLRAVFASGWGGLSASDLPETVLSIEAAPHDWLFPQVAAVVHHGGAGTTAAGLRAGKPSIVCSFFGDQAFWGARVHALGVGPRPVSVKKLNTDWLAQALTAATSDPTQRQRAADLGRDIQAEDGIGRAVDIIEKVVKDDG